MNTLVLLLLLTTQDLTPEQAVKRMKVADGFEVRLVASEPAIQLLPHQAALSAQPSVACGSVNGLCYDPASGHIEVNARDFMPNIRGLRRETINVKRDSITFKYSF